MPEGGAPVGRRMEQDFARRAPYAVAAALGVLACGAAFLAYAMSRSTASAPPAAATDTVAIAASEPTSIIAEPVAEAPAPPAIAELAAGPATPPRINPARMTRAAEGDLTPRLKPTTGAVAMTPSTTQSDAAVVSLATVWAADETSRAPAFFFEQDLSPADGASLAHRAPTDGDVAAPPHETRIVLAKGETFVDALRRAGVRASDRNEAALAFGKLYNMRRLRPGQELVLTVVEPNLTLFQFVSLEDAPPLFLLSLDFKVDSENQISLKRAPNARYDATQTTTPLTTRIAAARGKIDGSLYLSAKRQGAPDEVIAGLAQMFAYDVDFQRDVFVGDEFEALFEVRYDETGKMVGGGDILYGRLKWRNRTKEKGYYRFVTADGAGKAEYFDDSGESARRLLMKTPIDGARLSSGFGTRKHPILGYQKAHKGVDFAASRGTPIMAAGDGVIERAGPYGSFGNYVRIRHAQGYKTAYAHMNAIKKGVRTGARVRQGDVIGYVGSTGRSTGPHLHYEVHLKDKAVNPQSLKIATGVELSGKELARFREARDRIDAMLAPLQATESNLVADNDGGKQL